MTTRKIFEVLLIVGRDRELIRYLNNRFEDAYLGPGLHKRYIAFKPQAAFMNVKGKYMQWLIYYVDECTYEILQFIKNEYVDKGKNLPSF